jgi:hypothetical protein
MQHFLNFLMVIYHFLVIKSPANYLDLLNKNMINFWKTVRSIAVPVHCYKLPSYVSTGSETDSN